ncbi:MAG: hypothetical protein HY367_00965 [Candidatus Aenigmarchaeota archaeon]|nr:hypothetical protein [Candidatus Aenigmarchaeota archaeon]
MALLHKNLEVIITALLVLNTVHVGLISLALIGTFANDSKTQAAAIGVPAIPAQAIFTCPSEPPEAFITKTIGQEADDATKPLVSINSDISAARSEYKVTRSQASARKLQDLVASRKKLLIGAMRTSPEAAAGLILPEDQRNDIAAITRNCIETRTTVEGVLEVDAIDYEDGTAVEAYRLVMDNNHRISLYPAGRPHGNLVSGMRIRVGGFQLEDNILFDSSSFDGDGSGGYEALSQQTDSPPVYGSQRTVVIMVYFLLMSQPSLNQTGVDKVMNQNNDFYLENSYYQVWFNGSINQTSTSDIVGWYQIPRTQTCNQEGVLTDAIAAADPAITFNNYSRLVIIVPFSASCGVNGIGTIGKRSNVPTQDGPVNVSISWIAEFAVNNNRTVKHEFGHNFGNRHASFYDCGSVPIRGSGCILSEYGDIYSIMGQPSAGHYNALHKEYTGWFNQPGTPRIEEASQSGTYTIEPIETNTSGGLKAIKITRNPPDYLFIEYRQPIGADSGFSGTTVYDGALLHVRESGLASKSALIDPTVPPANASKSALLQGEKLTDPVTCIEVTTISRNSTSLTFNITLPSIPNVSITPPPDGSFQTGLVNVSASASDASGIDRVEFHWQTIVSNTTVLFGNDTTVPYEATLNTTQVPNGLNYIFARAFDSVTNCPLDDMADSPIVEIEVVNNVVYISSPLRGGYLRGNATINATVTSNINITVHNVSFFKDSDAQPFFVDSAPPYQANLDTTALSNGSHLLKVIGCNASNACAQPHSIFVAVDNEIPNTTLSPIASPASGIVTLSASGFDRLSIKNVDFYRDAGVLLGSSPSAPLFHCKFDSQTKTTCEQGEMPATTNASLVPGLTGSAIYVNGANHLEYDPQGNVNIENGSVEFWVRLNFDPNSSVHDRTFFDLSGAGGVNGTGLSYSKGAKLLVLYVNRGFGSGECSTYTEAPRTWGWGPNAEWHRIKAVWDANDPVQSLELYTDGVKAASFSCSGNGWVPIPVSKIRIGSVVSGLAGANSSIDDFKIYGEKVPPFTFSWNSNATPNGNHTIYAIANDSAGNSASSQNMTVTVSNSPQGGFANKPRPLRRA